MSSILVIVVASVSLTWYTFIAMIQVVGVYQIYKNYSSRPPTPNSATVPDEDLPLITIIRPIKGLDPNLYDCLASTFQLSYPASKLAVFFCLTSRDEEKEALTVVKQLLLDLPNVEAKIFIEQEDEELLGRNLGPNPKIRNMSRAYREAKSDVVWIVDCNVWISHSAANLMVDKLCGFGPNKTRVQPYRFVHQLPIVVDQGPPSSFVKLDSSWLKKAGSNASLFTNLRTMLDTAVQTKGGRLEEMYMATSHGKFYSFFCAAAARACVVGKSNMFRRSHLDRLTQEADSSQPSGIEYFSHNICEDQLIGTMLWQETSLADETSQQKWGKHALVQGAIVVQPVEQMSVGDFVSRRLRWQRVRKFEKLTAFIVEPGIESLVWSAHGAFAFTTLPFLHNKLGVSPMWGGFASVWTAGILAMCMIDWVVYNKLHSGVSQDTNENTPSWALPPRKSSHKRSFGEWMVAWIFRELLALPIWIMAGCGSTVTWRSRRFRVGTDMMVHELSPSKRV